MQTLQQKPVMQAENIFWTEKEVEIKQLVEAQIALARFEHAYLFFVSDKQRKETVKAVNEAKDKLWKEAMKKANGNKSKALTFFVSAYGKI